MPVPSIDHSTRWTGVSAKFTGSRGQRSNCGLNSWLSRGAGIIRALVAPCGNSLRRRHWAIAGKRTSGDAVGCAPSDADDPKVWSGRARAFQRGSGKTQRGLTTMLSHNPPPFHAEHIGSLLRPTELLDQRAKFARGEIDRTELTKAENEAIKDVIELQERVGLKLATDGEFRRRSYHSFFYRQLGEISIDTVGGEDAKCGEPGRRATQPVALINSRVRWTHPINVPDFQFIRAHSGLV